MSSTVLYMSMSLDGFVAGPNERPDNGLGDGGARLHEWAGIGVDEQPDGGDRGLLDEIQIHLVPVLLGEGRRLFEHLGAEHIELETVNVIRGQDATHLRYRVRR